MLTSLPTNWLQDSLGSQELTEQFVAKGLVCDGDEDIRFFDDRVEVGYWDYDDNGNVAFHVTGLLTK
jgi:hypothetical protein